MHDTIAATNNQSLNKLLGLKMENTENVIHLTLATKMSYKDELVGEYWDFYKCVHGVRPRWINFDACTEQELETMLKNLAEEAKVVFAQQEEDEKKAIITFENLVTMTIVSGAQTREDAIRWLMDSADVDGDEDYFCWKHGIPYGYLKRKA